MIVDLLIPELMKLGQTPSQYRLRGTLEMPLAGVVEEAEMVPANDSEVSVHGEQRRFNRSYQDILGT
jgi:hypothetical protein